MPVVRTSGAPGLPSPLLPYGRLESFGKSTQSTDQFLLSTHQHGGRQQEWENGVRGASTPGAPPCDPCNRKPPPLLAPAIPPDQMGSPLRGEAPHSSRSPGSLAHWRRKEVVLSRASFPVPSAHMRDDRGGVHPDLWPVLAHTRPQGPPRKPPPPGIPEPPPCPVSAASQLGAKEWAAPPQKPGSPDAHLAVHHARRVEVSQ